MTLGEEGREPDGRMVRGLAQPADQALPADFLAMLAEIVRRERGGIVRTLPALRH